MGDETVLTFKDFEDFSEIFVDDLFFVDRSSTAQNFADFTFLLQSWQPTITFHNFLRGGARIEDPCVCHCL